MESGRKSILSPDYKMLILKQIKNDNTKTLEEYSEIIFKKLTIKDRQNNKKFSKNKGLISKTPLKFYELSEDQKRIRKNWWIENKNYDWDKIVFTDVTALK